MRRCRFIVPALLAACGIAAMMSWPAPAAARAPFRAPLADRIPSDAQMYFGWVGPVAKWPGYKTSNLHFVLSRTHIAKFIEGNLPVLLRKLNELPATHNTQLNRAQFKTAIAVASLLITHSFAVYFRPIRTGIHHVAALPQAVLIMDAGKYPDAVLSLFKILPHQLYPSGPRLSAGSVGPMVYVGIHITSGVRRALAGKGTTLATADRFCRSMRFMPAEPVAADFADLTSLRHYANTILNHALSNPALRGTSHGRQQRIVFREAQVILNSRSLRNDTAFASADGFSGAQWVETSFLAMRHASIKKVSGAADMLTLAPEHSPAVTVSHLNLKAFVTTTKKTIEATSPQIRRNVRQVLTLINGITGVDMEKDVINAFGPYWLTYQSADMPMSSALGTVVVNRLAHPERLARALQTLTPMALLAVNAAMRQRGYTGTPAQLEILHAHGAVIYYIKANGIMPAWAIVHGYLYFSAYPHPIQLALGRKVSEPSILDNKKFMALQRQLGCTHDYTNAGYVDQPRLLSDTYHMITTEAAAYSLLLGLQFDPPISALIPRLSDLQKATTTSGFVTWTDKAGWHSRSISGYPGSSLFVP